MRDATWWAGTLSIPELARAFCALQDEAREEIRKGLARTGWWPRLELHRHISDRLARTRFRLSGSYDHTRDEAAQHDLTQTFRMVLAQEIYGWMRRDDLLESRPVGGDTEVRLARPEQQLRLIRDLEMVRWDEAVALGQRVLRVVDA